MVDVVKRAFPARDRYCWLSSSRRSNAAARRRRRQPVGTVPTGHTQLRIGGALERSRSAAYGPSVAGIDPGERRRQVIDGAGLTRSVRGEEITAVSSPAGLGFSISTTTGELCEFSAGLLLVSP